MYTSPQDIVTSQDIVALLHLTGFVTGIVLYAMLGAMTLRGGASSRLPDSERNGNSMPLAVAALGLVWNGIALAIYALRDLPLLSQVRGSWPLDLVRSVFFPRWWFIRACGRASLDQPGARSPSLRMD